MVRAYLAGEREAGVRRGSAVDPFDAVAAYVRQRLAVSHRVVGFEVGAGVHPLGGSSA